MSRHLRSIATSALVAGSALCGTAAAVDQGDILVRAGISVLDPKSDNLTLSPGTTLQIDDDTRPTFDVTYMFRDHWGVELFASSIWKHDLGVRTSASGTRLGEVSHLPPTLSVQYHFAPIGRFRPYVGLGVNYTFLFNEEPDALGIDNSFGPAAQLGLDFDLDDHWFANLSARYIDIDAEARLASTRLGTVEVDPVVYGINLGYRFGR
jgi:outer membrane protein